MSTGAAVAAQEQSGASVGTGAPAQDPASPAEDKRVFGVIPNNRTTEASLPFAPISAKRKMTIAAKDSFDWPVFPTAAVFAAFYQLENQNPSFGQGVKGYATRFAAAYGDQMIGNMMTEGIIPSLGHQDPRYFRLGEGSKRHRILYAASRIFVAKMDSGKSTFNFSEWVGNGISVALSNAWYPDTRTVHENLQKLGIQCGVDAFSNVLKELWPDIRRHFSKKKAPASGGAAASSSPAK